MTDSAKLYWRDFICQSQTGARLLSSIGSAVALSESASTTEADIERFLKALRGGARDVRTIAGITDLLSREYHDFFSNGLVALLDHLSSETVHTEQIVGPALRGNPRWDKTLVGRAARTLPPGRYYSRLPRRSFSRPENLLIKWLISETLDELHHIQKQVGIFRLPEQLRNLYARVELVNRSYGISEIDVPACLTPDMVSAAKKGRRKEYRQAATLACRRNEYNKEVSHGKLKAILRLLALGWLEPIDVDDLFELYALTFSLEILSSHLGLGPPVELGLIIRKRDYIARYKMPDGTIDIYFDQAPQTTLSGIGKYSQITKQHTGLSGKARRPDITIVRTNTNGTKRVLLVEVKKTQSKEYLSDSLYKAFGYLYDYSYLWKPSDSRPKIVLLVPESVHLLDKNSTPEAVFISASDTETAIRVFREALW